MRVLSEGTLDAPETFCCDSAKVQLTNSCHDNHTTGTKQCPDQVITYSSKFREHYISPVGCPTYSIRFCPFCGTELPTSLRDEWFSELEALGISHPLFEVVPEPFKTSQWWKELKL